MTGLSLARPSAVVSARGPSSRDTVTGSPLRCGTATGTTSASNLPASQAAAARYATHTTLSTGDTLAIYDLGGGTFDAAIVCTTPDGFSVLGDRDGIERYRCFVTPGGWPDERPA